MWDLCFHIENKGPFLSMLTQAFILAVTGNSTQTVTALQRKVTVGLLSPLIVSGNNIYTKHPGAFYFLVGQQTFYITLHSL